MIIMPLFGNVFYESGRLKSLLGKGAGKSSGLADVADNASRHRSVPARAGFIRC